MAKLIFYTESKCPECGFEDQTMILPGNIPEVRALVEEYRRLLTQSGHNEHGEPICIDCLSILDEGHADGCASAAALAPFVDDEVYPA